MDYVDIIERLVPSPSHTLVVKTPKGDIALVDTERMPVAGDTVFTDDARFLPYKTGTRIAGVTYCLIRFL